MRKLSLFFLKVVNKFLQKLLISELCVEHPSTGYANEAFKIKSIDNVLCGNDHRHIDIDRLIAKNDAIARTITASKMKSFIKFPYEKILIAFALLNECKTNAGEFLHSSFVIENVLLFDAIIKNKY